MASLNSICVRIPPEQKTVLDTAASVSGRTRTAILLEGAMRLSGDILSNRIHYAIPDDKWEEFMEALDAQTRDNPTMRKTMSTNFPW